jgi:predicted Rossmann-fold nucleotide-binding protein
MNIGGYHIGFAGTSHLRDFDDDEEHNRWRILAQEIGGELMRRGLRLVTGGCSGGLTEYCVKSAAAWLEKHGRGEEKELRIVSIVSQEKPPTVEIGRVMVCENWSRNQRRAYMTSLMDSLITIGGETGTTREGQCAFCVGTPVIPVYGTGGSSLKLWKQISRDFGGHPLYEMFVTSEAWKALGQIQSKNLVKTAREYVQLAVAMAEQKVKLHGRHYTDTQFSPHPELPNVFRVFVIMPFDSSFNKVYKEISLAFTDPLLRDEPGGEVECVRADEQRTGRIDESTLQSIREADLLIADLTGNNGNVLFEYGYGLALGKRMIALSQNPDNTVADVRNHKQIPYDINKLGKSNSIDLRYKLLNAIRGLSRSHKSMASAPSTSSNAFSKRCEAVEQGFHCMFQDRWGNRNQGIV